MHSTDLPNTITLLLSNSVILKSLETYLWFLKTYRCCWYFFPVVMSPWMNSDYLSVYGRIKENRQYQQRHYFLYNPIKKDRIWMVDGISSGNGRMSILSRCWWSHLSKDHPNVSFRNTKGQFWSSYFLSLFLFFFFNVLLPSII